ncbi:YigZ family protein [Mergibacter septicus]|uniref:YigZ family protein n=1 Tax=Mergibacter septicus TaxID=221402 RepID=UPI002240941E|nr:YigZ family protein [Mergibacter septicus]
MMQYLVLKNPVVFEEEIKKSRFITYLRRVNGLAEARAFWQEMRETYPTARHHCWATVAGRPQDSGQYGFSDDGEPTGTAGKPMINALIGSGIGEISVVSVRYFGGVLLGTGGLVRAYGNGVQQALKLAQTEIKIERSDYQLVCSYEQLNRILAILPQYQVELYHQDFTEVVRLTLGIIEQQRPSFELTLQNMSAGQLTLTKIEP